mmetsp:Transcript_26081/g.65174  ORF Transcript_26081/g.65174 Transcript_26081/m.65174 type:complete len:291 (+) Transcript_26081:165-1037(+)
MMLDSAAVALAFSKSGELLATAGRGAAGEVVVWRVATGRVLRRFRVGKPATCVAFSPDATQVACGTAQGMVVLLGMHSGKALRECVGHTASVNDLCWLPGSRAAGSASSKPAEAEPAAGVGSGSVMMPESTIVSAGGDGDVRLWRAASGECIKVIPPWSSSSASNVRDVASALVCQPSRTSTTTLLIAGRGIEPCVVTLPGGAVEKLIAGGPDAAGWKGTDVVAATWSTRDGFVYVLRECGKVAVVSRSTGNVEMEWRAHDKEPLAIAHHPSKNLLATTGMDNVVKLWKS